MLDLLRLLVGARFQVLFHSPLGVLFTFPSRYWCTIGHRRVFSLGRWSSQLRTGFHVPGPTRDYFKRIPTFRIPGFHRLWPAFPCRFAKVGFCDRLRTGKGPRKGPATPVRRSLAAACAYRFGLVRVRSPLLAQSRLISLPPGT